MQGKAFPYVGQGYAEYVAQIIRATRKCGLRYYAVSRNFIGGIFMESNRKSKIFKGVAVGALALIVAALSVLGIWAVRKNKTESMPVDFSRDNGGMIVADSGKNTGIRLMSKQLDVSEYAVNAVSATADSAFVITATITPDTATNQAITCKPAFTNPESEWATGKTLSDYVTTSVSSLKITVTCLQPFGEQITLTVASQDNPNAKASCTVDYLKRVSSMSMSLGGTTLIDKDKINGDPENGEVVEAPQISFDLNNSVQPQTFELNVVEGIGTISNTYSIKSVVMDFSEEFCHGPFAEGLIPVIKGPRDFTSDICYHAADGTESDLTQGNSLDVTIGASFDLATWKHFFGEGSTEPLIITKFKNYLGLSCTDTYLNYYLTALAYGVFEFTVSIECAETTTDGEGGAYTFTYPVRINPDNLYVGVSSLTSDTQDYVF